MSFDKEMLKGVAEPIILKLLSDKTMYGYEIIKVVNEKTGGKFEWKEGTLYPILHKLENTKLLKSKWSESDAGRKRKYYSISKKGEKLLANKTKEWNTFSQTVSALLEPALGI